MPVYLALHLYLIGDQSKFLKREKTSRVSFGGRYTRENLASLVQLRALQCPRQRKGGPKTQQTSRKFQQVEMSSKVEQAKKLGKHKANTKRIVDVWKRTQP